MLRANASSLAITLALLASTVALSSARAGEQTEEAKATASPTPESRFKIYGWVDGGITFNPAGPRDNQ
ncbi:MAG TPA: hypothetical protein VNW28_09930, partial [Chthoniobacterales bacterium]|nr:hypothetical protein [Chthoniobacterales bacterium]